MVILYIPYIYCLVEIIKNSFSNLQCLKLLDNQLARRLFDKSHSICFQKPVKKQDLNIDDKFNNKILVEKLIFIY